MKNRWFWRSIPLVLLVLSALVILPNRDTLTVQAVLSWTPRIPFLAAVFLLTLFAAKSISLFFPLAVLEAASGLLFPLWAALTVNLLGVALAQSLPYFLGRHQQEDLQTLLARKPRLAALWALRGDNTALFVFLIRLCGVLPGDLVSMALGAAGVSWRVYLPMGLLGALPHLTAVTVLGAALTNIGGELFFMALAGNAAITVLALVVWRLWQHKEAAQ